MKDHSETHDAIEERTGLDADADAGHGPLQGGPPFSNWAPTVSVALGLLLLAAWTRRHNLAPTTLTHDDAWVAYITRVGYSDSLVVGMTSPGFVFLQRVWFGVVGYSELRAQILPWSAGVIAPTALFLVLRHRTRPAYAALAGFVLALSPIGIVYSAHVKQYTGEVLFGVALVGTGFWLLDSVRDGRRWAIVSTLAVTGTVFSFSVGIAAMGPLLAATTLIAAKEKDWRSVVWTFRWTAPVGLFVVGWYVVALQPRLPDGLARIWGPAPGREGRYIATDGGVLLWGESLLNRLTDMTQWLLPINPRLTATIGFVLIVVLLLRRPIIFVLCATPMVAAIALASLSLAPLGGARTDMYFHAQLVAGMAVGLDEATSLIASHYQRYRRERSWATVATRALPYATAIIIAGWIGLTGYTPPPYPLQDMKPLIAQLEAERRPDDYVFVEWEGMYHVGLYGTGDSSAVGHEDYGYRHYLVDFEDDRLVRVNDPSQTDQYLAEISPRATRLWFIVSQNPFLFHTRDKWTRLDEKLAENGWARTGRREEDAAILELWERS